jgi:hypothetical protein
MLRYDYLGKCIFVGFSKDLAASLAHAASVHDMAQPPTAAQVRSLRPPDWSDFFPREKL